MQLIAGQSLAAAPSTLLSVSGVSIQKKGEEEEEKCIVTTMTGNLVQGGLTITGIYFKDFIECCEVLGVWESQLSMDAMVRVGACSLVINSTMSNPRGVSSNPSFLIF